MLKLFRSRQSAFFETFVRLGDNVERGVELLEQLVRAPAQAAALIPQIKEIETKGDEYTQNFIQTLNQTFITPFDREDAHQLAELVDNILDHANNTATRFRLFNITEPISDLVEITRVLREQVRHLAAAMRHLTNQRELFDLCARIDELETRADSIYNAAIARMFQNRLDPLELIKQKDLIEIIETATDECEDISDLLKSIVLKYS